MKKLLKKIIKEGIVIDLKDGELQLFSSGENVDSVLISEIKSRKEELISYLTKNRKGLFRNSKYEEIPVTPFSLKYPLSNSQLRLWYASQLEEGHAAFNMPNTITLTGDYDVGSFQKAIYALLNRHEILRTVFKLDETGEVSQYILTKEELNFNIGYLDFKKEKNPLEAARKYVLSDSHKPFNLDKGPLLRVALLHISSDNYQLYFNMHHIISDEWSMDILFKDIMTFYNAYKDGVEISITPLRIQYKDYAVWQLAELEKPEYKSHREFWIKKLSSEIPKIDFPSNQLRPKLKTSNGNNLVTYFSPILKEQIFRFIKIEDGSLFMFMLTAINILIYRYTASKDVIVGSPSAGRFHPDLENQIENIESYRPRNK